MAGVFDYKRYINIFATAEDVLQIFPRDQRSLTFSFNNLGQDGWTCDIDWMTLVIDQIKWKEENEPDFTNSTVIGYFEGSTSTVVQTGTNIVFPNNMYTGPILPAANRNIPITALNINWYKGNLNFQRQFLLIQNWEPGTTIGDPEQDPNFIPIVEAYPIFVNWGLSTSTGQVGTSVTVTATATATSSTAIMSTVSARLVEPFFPQITTSTLTTTNFLFGEMIGTFTIYTDWIDNVLTPSSTFTITSATLTTSTYTIVADITRNHPIRLQWLYDKERKYRGGYSNSITFTATDTRTFVYVGQPIGITLTQQSVNQRSGNTSTFTVSHNKPGEGAITGQISLDAMFTPVDGGATQSVTLSTGTFNNNGVFTVTQVLATGTYLLQATYAGNLSVDIFKTQYLNTVSNSLTHYVQLGRTFTLTEMLIQEGPNYDYLYAHAIDDGLSDGEIGGLVTFYHNGNSLGTSTFVRHTYAWPTQVPQVDRFKLAGVNNGFYPYPYDPNVTFWPNNFPYGMQPLGRWYSNSIDTSKPSHFATFKTNSTQIDWPPTTSVINTIGIQNIDTTTVPTTPFTIQIPHQSIAGSFYTITCVEYLGTINIPSYPAQTLTIEDYFNPNLREWIGVGGNSEWQGTANWYTVPQAPNPLNGSILPRYDNNALSRGQVRPNGRTYGVRVTLNGTQYINKVVPPGATVEDLGDAWPVQYTGSSRPSHNNVMVFRFAEALRAPDEIDGDLLFYGRKEWYYGDFFDNQRCQSIYKALTGQTSVANFNLTVAYSNSVTTRSHLATLQLPLGTVPTTGTFTATFAGSLQNGSEGYYPEGIPFQDTAGSIINLYLNQNPPEIRRTTTSSASQTWGLTVENFDYNRDVIGQLVSDGKPNPSVKWQPAYRYGRWLSGGFGLTTAAWWYNSVITHTRSITLGQLPSIEVISTSVAYPNILAPIGRFYPSQLSTTYYKRLGWLSRRTPQGTVSLKCNASTFTNTLQIVDTGTNTVVVFIGNQTFRMQSESNLPPPLRYDNNPWRSGTGSPYPSAYNISSLSIMGVTSATSTSTSTVVMPITLQYTPSKAGLPATTSSGGATSIKLSRGITLAFSTNTSVTTIKQTYNGFLELQAPTEQNYLVYSGVHTIPWRNISGNWYRIIYLNGAYRILTPQRENDQPLWWYQQWKIERWSSDGSTLFTTQYLTAANFSAQSNPYAAWEAIVPGIMEFGQGYYLIYSSANEDGIKRTGPEPANEPYLWKFYVSLTNASVPSPTSSNFTRNNVFGNNYGQITGPLSNGLISRQAEWVFDPTFIAFTTINNTGTEIILYAQNGV